jgi:hypothetical protein
MKKSLKKFFEDVGTYLYLVLRPKKLAVDDTAAAGSAGGRIRK